MNYLTSNEIHVCGLQRTGQHAISAWLIGHFDNVCFRNGMPPKNNIRNKNKSLCPPFWYFELNKKKFTWESSNEWNIRDNQDAIILGTEYLDTGVELASDLTQRKKEIAQNTNHNKFSEKENYILVLRSPWNHLASVLRWKNRWYLKNKHRFIKGWLNSAREYLGITNLIPNPKICLNYDKWFVDKKYRQSISKQLGLRFSDRGLNIVMPVGWGKKGSSFDQMEYNHNAQKMKVLERWKEYQDNTIEFKNVLKMNDELREMAIKIFGPFPGNL